MHILHLGCHLSPSTFQFTYNTYVLASTRAIPALAQDYDSLSSTGGLVQPVDVADAGIDDDGRQVRGT